MTIKAAKIARFVLGSAFVAASVFAFLGLTRQAQAVSGVKYGFEVNKKEASRGETLRYTIQIRNDASNGMTIHDVLVSDTLAPYTTYKKGSTIGEKNGVPHQFDDNWIIGTKSGFNAGHFAPGSVATIYFDVIVNDDAPNGANLDNVIHIRATEDADETQCMARTTVRVPKGAVLSIDKRVKWENGSWMDSIERGAHGHVFGAGEKVFYQIEIANTGDEGVDNVKITDNLPDYIRISDNSIVVTTIGRLEPGQSKTYEYEAIVVDSPSGEKKQENVAKFMSGDDEKARDIAYVWIAGGSRVLGEVKEPTKLPEAGDMTGLLSVFGSLGSALIGFGLRKRSDIVVL